MTIQEALAELGVEKVRKGTRSFAFNSSGTLRTCFCGFAYGNESKLYHDFRRIVVYEPNKSLQESLWTAIGLHLGVSWKAGLEISNWYEHRREAFEQEVTLFLAENGSEKETEVQKEELTLA